MSDSSQMPEPIGLTDFLCRSSRLIQLFSALRASLVANEGSKRSRSIQSCLRSSASRPDGFTEDVVTVRPQHALCNLIAHLGAFWSVTRA